ncbi:unnamed protein product [Mytilus coruscus]|uniref:B box-type domain-containing protein n=1 Tax=Mytilus coruscus TaxID=42192 RepID=A0A6J8EZ58_MYTCO|nr:unnamed protein product [Mytilus coruscus]
MASAAHTCGICDLRHVTKPSEAWCSECDEGFCSGCVEHHSLAKATRHHKTIPIAEYQTLPQNVLQIPQSCTKHDEKLILYCKDHELPCCGKCAMEGHKGCNEVVNLDDIVKNSKTSTSFQEIEETLAEVVDNIKEVQKIYRGNITTLSENRKQIEKQIQDIRFKIDTHLNEIQKKLVDGIQKVEETERKKVRQLVKRLEEKENNLTKYQKTVANIKHHASDLQTFMSIRQMELEISREEEFTQSCLEGDKVNTRVITCSMAESIDTFTKSVQRFGEIVVEIKPTKAALRRSKKKQAQIVLPKIQTKPLENVTALLQQTIQTTSGNVRGCCILPDARMVFTCYNTGRLIIIKADGSKDFEIQLTRPVDVVNSTTENRVIVSSCNQNRNFGINIIDIKDRKIRKFIRVKSQCYGLVEKDGNLIICTRSDLKILNLQTESIKAITNENVSAFSYVDTNGINIYYTSLLKNSISCCKFEGVVKWTIKDVNILASPHGVFVNDNGLVFVLSFNSVVIISPCGKQSKQIITEGLSNAQALHYNKSREMLLVANSKETAFLFKVDLK